ncbi:uncharacterized protein YbjQ (UPF0145 family) [Krasilnikovia cinnamomea]|uniref:Uncharacterized protein YbjQ (UPF0145 family) n=1 Tax=Krasilnikovia cinnamomea TaxID=349313 RepID=A0A4Q7ZP32_9ACTN|nr:heavy metal-binding domain-containing protein [Krasilnikovia cinnamomea]RZU52464.1 uncharacterized protein YbjQ (UPF0145 family) [Krasilnikovia cinnamomea]
MLIVTLPSIPGYDTRLTLGPVLAEALPQQPNLAEHYKMAFDALNSRQILNIQAMREQAMQDVLRQAAQRGANAVLGLCFNGLQIYATLPVTLM